MQLDVADIAHARQIHHHALEAQAEARVVAGAVPAQVAVPPVVLRVHAQLLDAALEQLQTLLALAAADDLADAGDKAVRRGDGLAVVIETHVKRLDFLGIVGHEHGLLIDLLGQEALVLGLQVGAPLDLIVELVVVLHEDIDGLGIAHAAEVARHDVLQTLPQPLVHEAVEEVDLIGAALEHAADDVLDHRLGHVHVAREVAERHLRLDHPELGGVALCVGVLGTERRAEGIHVAEGHGEVLGVELTGDGQARLLAEEVLAVVHGAVLRLGDVVQVKRRHLEHLARALAVAARDDGCLDIDKAAALEELVHGVGRDGADAERRGEEVRPRAQMLDRAQELHAVALFLQGIVGGGLALHLDGDGLDLERLLGLGRQHDGALHDEGGADILRGNLLIILQLVGGHDHLQIPEAGAVVQLDKAEGLEVADRAGPAADDNLLAGERFAVGKNRCDSCAFHIHFTFSVSESSLNIDICIIAQIHGVYKDGFSRETGKKAHAANAARAF